jgi:hypothetical protein
MEYYFEQFVEKICDWCESKGRFLRITGTGGPDDLYLIRYYVFKSKFLNIFIHRFFRSDRDDMHDHPWNFFTYLVRGAYTEHRWNPETRLVDITRRKRAFWADEDHQNRFVFRRAEDQHKVMVDRQYLWPLDKTNCPLTICVTGRSRREWGFVRELPISATEFLSAQIEKDMYGYTGVIKQTKRVWFNWREYLGLPPDEPGRG